MRALVVTLIVLGSLPFILTKPHIGVYMWSWLGYMNPHRLAWATALPYAQIVAAVTLLAIIFTKEERKIPWTREAVLLLIFVLWMWFTTFFAQYQDVAWLKWDKVWKVQLFIFITLMFINTRERLQILVWVIVVSIGFFGVKGGIFTIRSGGTQLVLGPEGSFIATRGEIGTALNMVLPLMRYLQLTMTKWWAKYAFTGAMVLTVLAIVGTSSRGAFLGTLVVMAFLFIKSRGKFMMLIFIAATAYGAYTFAPPEWKERMHSIETYEQDASAMGRIEAWKYIIRVTADSPIVGGGFDITAGRTAAHSIYFQILGDHGYVGLALFLALGFMTWRTGSWVRKQAKKHTELQWAGDLAAMTQVGMAAYAVGGAFISQAYFDLIYHYMAIIVILKMLTMKYLLEHGMLRTELRGAFRGTRGAPGTGYAEKRKGD